ncbi:hypothetical protein RDV64_06895 [Acuticoccus sp. MNP-M23]|uniref:hypothetical protein n=1 Tax=Acuticoccus sp. MNP-M23 TaxID=3072793 RepID=UPI002815BCD1|nr:hypothetical protein [Acuticoccus sp. MNP-M23]WMS44111.1 hypothetical protein RDV64_06895 [Acuticoccus sp. MNP-M23]
MGDRETCRDILAIVPETAVLAFDVVGWTDPDGPRRMANAQEVRKAIDAELTKQAEALHKKHFAGKTVTQEDAVKLLMTVPKEILDKQKKEAGERLKCAYQESPLGVWLDRNSWVLYVFAPIVVGAAGTIMYVARTGDQPASWATGMAKTKKSFTTKHLGTVTLGTNKVTFVPSTRSLSVNAFGEMKWERVAVKLTLGGGMSEGEYNASLFGVDLTTAVTRDLDLKIGSQAANHMSQWGGTSTVGLNYKGSGAAANTSIMLGSQFSYGQTGAFEGMPAVKPPPMGATFKLELKFAF